MVTGVVTNDREAQIPIVVAGPDGRRDIDAVIDTGFTGSLTLPSQLIEGFQMPWLCRQPGILADGSVHFFDVYVATVVWNGVEREVEVEAVESGALAGMSLLEGHTLRIEIIAGGRVTVVPFS